MSNAMSRRLRSISEISRCRCRWRLLAAPPLAGARRRSAAGARHAARAGRLVRHRRLGRRRSRRRLRDLPHELQSVPGARTPTRDTPADPAARCGEVCRRAAAAGALDNDKAGARLLRGEFPAGADRQARRDDRPAHRLLRADRRRLALPESGILGAALPAPERHAGRRQEGAQDGAAQPGERRRASTPRSRSSPITIALPSRTARSTGSGSRSPGSRIPGRR